MVIAQMRELMCSQCKEIDIKIVGLRPGEKLHEALFDDYEVASPSSLAGVFELRLRSPDAYVTPTDLSHLESVARSADHAVVRRRVFALLDARLNRLEREVG